MNTILKNITALLFPPLCLGCEWPLSDHEVQLCTRCRHQLPLTHIHTDDTEAAAKIFYGRVKIEKATAMLWFEKKGIVQQLIHRLKYKGHEEVGEFLGHWLGMELAETPHYNTVDAVIPVPLHPKKQRKRGYNQVATFAKALAEHIDAAYRDDILIRKQYTRTQTHKNRLSRWESIQDVFAVQHSETVSGKHILLVDDVITTGATLEACTTELLRAPDVKISVATMAIVA